MIRKPLGWCVAQAYRFVGARRRAIARVLTPGTILPVVFHAAKADEVRAVLGWLRRNGCLKHVWLSFDDGWRTFADTVKVLEEFETPATLFVAPGEIRRGRVWTDGLTVRARQSLYAVGAEERYARLGDPGARRLLTEDEVRALARHPLVRIGNHTWSHLSCTHRPLAEVMDEIDRAQSELTAWCGSAPVDFAYPFGRGTPELDALVRERGLTPHYARPGLVTAATLGAARNMAYDGDEASVAENLGRILMAWPHIGETL